MRYLIILLTLLMLSGCYKFGEKEAAKAKKAKQAKQKQQQDAAAKPAGQQPILGKMTNVIVDADEALKDPNIRELGKRKIPIADPLTQAAAGYFLVTARVSVLNLKHNVDIYRAQHDKFPTYKELMKMLKQHGIQMAQLRPYEMYGYHQKTGEIVILEDMEKKEQHGPTIPLQEE